MIEPILDDGDVQIYRNLAGLFGLYYFGIYVATFKTFQSACNYISLEFEKYPNPMKQ